MFRELRGAPHSICHQSSRWSRSFPPKGALCPGNGRWFNLRYPLLLTGLSSSARTSVGVLIGSLPIRSDQSIVSGKWKGSTMLYPWETFWIIVLRRSNSFARTLQSYRSFDREFDDLCPMTLSSRAAKLFALPQMAKSFSARAKYKFPLRGR